MGPDLVKLVSFQEDTGEGLLSLSSHAQRKVMQGCSEKAAIYGPHREISPETALAGTLILDFSSFQNYEKMNV